MSRCTLLSVLIVAVLVSTTWAQEPEWKKVREADGIKVYLRTFEGSSIYEAKSVGMVGASLASIEALLRDVHAMEEYAFNCHEATIIDLPGKEKSKDIIYGYVRIDFPWPVMDRDAVGEIKFTVDPKTGTLYVRSDAIKSDYKLSPDVIRTPTNIIKYSLVPKDANNTEMTVQGFVDPGGSIPPAVINFFAKFGSIWTFNCIRKMAVKEKYHRDTTILTTTQADTNKDTKKPL
jgi:hypothetical protein